MPFTPSVERSSHKKRRCSGRIRPSSWVAVGALALGPVGAFVAAYTNTAFLGRGRPVSTLSRRRSPHPWTSQLGGAPAIEEPSERERCAIERAMAQQHGSARSRPLDGAENRCADRYC